MSGLTSGLGEGLETGFSMSGAVGEPATIDSATVSLSESVAPSESVAQTGQEGNEEPESDADAGSKRKREESDDASDAKRVRTDADAEGSTLGAAVKAAAVKRKITHIPWQMFTPKIWTECVFASAPKPVGDNGATRAYWKLDLQRFCELTKTRQEDYNLVGRYNPRYVELALRLPQMFVPFPIKEWIDEKDATFSYSLMANLVHFANAHEAEGGPSLDEKRKELEQFLTWLEEMKTGIVSAVVKRFEDFETDEMIKKKDSAAKRQEYIDDNLQNLVTPPKEEGYSSSLNFKIPSSTNESSIFDEATETPNRLRLKVFDGDAEKKASKRDPHEPFERKNIVPFVTLQCVTRATGKYYLKMVLNTIVYREPLLGNDNADGGDSDEECPDF